MLKVGDSVFYHQRDYISLIVTSTGGFLPLTPETIMIVAHAEIFSHGPRHEVSTKRPQRLPMLRFRLYGARNIPLSLKESEMTFHAAS